MEPTVDQVLVLLRFTALAGPGAVRTPPMNVRAYSRANVTFRLVSALGAMFPAVTVRLQESPDLDVWEDVGAPLSHLGETDTRSFRFEWVRLEVDVSGGDPGITCWCVADLVRRER
jgi:hypothetical protein